ncbi:MAG: hypothetical protein ISR65_18205 [Bacteriovoracaceae bacterium]|nr:hypothetical protein [Bacteriovoracaceae bacterium]
MHTHRLYFFVLIIIVLNLASCGYKEVKKKKDKVDIPEANTSESMSKSQLKSLVTGMELAFSHNPLNTDYIFHLNTEVLPGAFHTLSLAEGKLDTKTLATQFKKAELYLTMAEGFEYLIRKRPMVKSFFDGLGRGLQNVPSIKYFDRLNDIDEYMTGKYQQEITTLLAASIISELNSIKQLVQELYAQYIDNNSKLSIFKTSINKAQAELTEAMDAVSNAYNDEASEHQVLALYTTYYRKHLQFLEDPSIRLICLDSKLAEKFGRIISKENAHTNAFDYPVTLDDLRDAITKNITTNLDKMIQEVQNKSSAELVADIIFYPASVADILASNPRLIGPITNMLNVRFKEVYDDNIFAKKLTTYLDYASSASVVLSLSTFGIASTVTWGAKWAIKRTVNAALVKKVAGTLMASSAIALGGATGATAYNTYRHNYNQEHFEKSFMAGLSPSALKDTQRELDQFRENLTRLIITSAFTAVPIGSIMSFSKRLYKQFPYLKQFELDNVGLLRSMFNSILKAFNKNVALKEFNSAATTNPVLSAFARKNIAMTPTASLPKLTKAQEMTLKMRINLARVNADIASQRSTSSAVTKDLFANNHGPTTIYNQTASGSRLEALMTSVPKSNPFVYNHIYGTSVEPASELSARLMSLKNAAAFKKANRFVGQRAKTQARRAKQAMRRRTRRFLNLPRPDAPKALSWQPRLLLEHKPTVATTDRWTVISLPDKTLKQVKSKARKKTKAKRTSKPKSKSKSKEKAKAKPAQEQS